MDVEVFGDRRFDLVQEATELLRAVAAIAFADDAAGDDVERCEQGGHAVALVSMAAPLRLSWSHRQHRLAAVERLDLALFIDAQDQRTLGRRQVEPDNVAHLLDEQGISRELEALRTVRLKAKGFPRSEDHTSELQSLMRLSYAVFCLYTNIS